MTCNRRSGKLNRLPEVTKVIFASACSAPLGAACPTAITEICEEKFKQEISILGQCLNLTWRVFAPGRLCVKFVLLQRILHAKAQSPQERPQSKTLHILARGRRHICFLLSSVSLFKGVRHFA